MTAPPTPKPALKAVTKMLKRKQQKIRTMQKTILQLKQALHKKGTNKSVHRKKQAPHKETNKTRLSNGEKEAEKENKASKSDCSDHRQRHTEESDRKSDCQL